MLHFYFQLILWLPQLDQKHYNDLQWRHNFTEWNPHWTVVRCWRQGLSESKLFNKYCEQMHQESRWYLGWCSGQQYLQVSILRHLLCQVKSRGKLIIADKILLDIMDLSYFGMLINWNLTEAVNEMSIMSCKELRSILWRWLHGTLANV